MLKWTSVNVIGHFTHKKVFVLSLLSVLASDVPPADSESIDYAYKELENAAKNKFAGGIVQVSYNCAILRGLDFWKLLMLDGIEKMAIGILYDWRHILVEHSVMGFQLIYRDIRNYVAISGVLDIIFRA